MERITKDKIPDGHIAVEGDELPEILLPLIQAISGRDQSDAIPDEKCQNELDNTIDGLAVSGDLGAFSRMSDEAFSLLTAKIHRIMLIAYESDQLNEPFMVCRKELASNRAKILVDLILKEFRSPKDLN